MTQFIGEPLEGDAIRFDLDTQDRAIHRILQRARLLAI
jgi:hypothetical protein